MAAGNGLLRAFRFVQLMQRATVRPTAPQIARTLGVSLRHAKRYVAAANAAHIAMPPTVDQVEAR